MSRNTKCRAMAIVPYHYILLSMLQLVVRNVGFIIAIDDDDDPMAIHVAVSKILFARTYAGVVYLKEGDIQSCIPEPIDISLQDPAYMAVLSNVISNPGEYCPGILE